MAINTICETWTMDHGAKRTEQGRASKAQGGASEVSGDSPPDKGRDSVCEADCDCESAWSVVNGTIFDAYRDIAVDSIVEANDRTELHCHGAWWWPSGLLAREPALVIES